MLDNLVENALNYSPAGTEVALERATARAGPGRGSTRAPASARRERAPVRTLLPRRVRARWSARHRPWAERGGVAGRALGGRGTPEQPSRAGGRGRSWRCPRTALYQVLTLSSPEPYRAGTSLDAVSLKRTAAGTRARAGRRDGRDRHRTAREHDFRAQRGASAEPLSAGDALAPSATQRQRAARRREVAQRRSEAAQTPGRGQKTPPGSH